MSITLGQQDLDARPHAWTFMLGGTGSGPEPVARVLYRSLGGMAGAVWADEDVRLWAVVHGWEGGWPVTVGRETHDPRRDGLNTLMPRIHDIRAKAWGIGLVGFSNGGGIAMRAADRLLSAAGYRGKVIRLVTISTPPLAENRGVAKRLGQHVRTGRLDWLGITEPDDPVDAEAAVILEQSGKPYGVTPWGHESAFLTLDTRLSGIPAHDQFPGQQSTRLEIARYFGRQR